MEYLADNDDLLALEREKWAEGVCYIAGVDEVGRGPLAGPVVSAAVVFPPRASIPKVNDSKKLTEKRRETLYDEILAVAGVRYAIVEIDSEEIDKINILQAARKSMIEAVERVGQVDHVFVDGLPFKGFDAPDTAIVKGDSKSASIAAASILAKVHRDRLMVAYAEKWPEYSFEKHKGYGTSEHLLAIEKHGACPIHRRSFAPIRKALGLDPVQMELF